MVLPTSSATSSAPDLSIATPTGRPIASPFSLTNPVNTSIGCPDGMPCANGTKITLYPLRGLRFHEPCCPTNIPPLKGAGRDVAPDQARPSDAVCGAKRVVRNDGALDELGPLWMNPRIDVLAVIAEWPAVKSAVAHRGDVIGDEITAELVALVDGDPQLVRLRLPGEPDWIP